MKNHIDALKQKANECIDRAVVESEKICTNSIRYLINTEFNFGRFHAYIDILKEVDFDSYIKLVEYNKLKCNEILCNIENIYQWGNLQEAIGHISYNSYPHINQALIKNLNEAIYIIDNAMDAETKKP